VSVRVTVSSGDIYPRVEAAAREATKRAMGELFAAFQQSFTAKVWDWPRETIRGQYRFKGRGKRRRRVRSGAVGFKVGSPRNLIDIGNLRQTGSWRMTGSYQATFKWSANYATAVHEGAWIHPWGNKDADKVLLPARPWTRAVLGQEQVAAIKPFPLQQRLKDVWLAKLRSGR
jgi:hypothetical protein